jgi:hypothetical protein
MNGRTCSPPLVPHVAHLAPDHLAKEANQIDRLLGGYYLPYDTEGS